MRGDEECAGRGVMDKEVEGRSKRGRPKMRQLGKTYERGDCLKLKSGTGIDGDDRHEERTRGRSK